MECLSSSSDFGQLIAQMTSSTGEVHPLFDMLIRRRTLMSIAHSLEQTRPLTEAHQRKQKATVWFSGAVVALYQTYLARQQLVNALGDAINKIPAIYIPYGTLVFEDKMFIYCSLWSEEDREYSMEIDLATHGKHVCDIVLPDEVQALFDEQDLENVTIN